MSRFKIIIVGGGLSGALLANGLLNNDVDFVIYERDEKHSKREGYQIRIGDGAQTGFRACLIASQIDAINHKLGKSSANTQTAPSLYTTQLKEIIDLTSLPTYSTTAGMNRVVMRDILLSWIPLSRINYSTAFANYEVVTEGEEEKIKVNFQNGSFDFCDILIGADGASSRINKQLGLENISRIDTHWSFVCKGNCSYQKMLQLPRKLRHGPMGVTSQGITLYYALYLPEAASGTPDKDMEIQFDEEEASFYWALMVPTTNLKFNDPKEIEGEVLDIVLNQVKDWHPDIHKMLSIGRQDTSSNAIQVLRFHASNKPDSEWRRKLKDSSKNVLGNSRVWLLGDAIHAMLPIRGQGGNQALQDCADALPLLLQLNDASKVAKGNLSNHHVDTAVEEYERIMIPRAFEWVKKSGGQRLPSYDFDGWLGVVIRLIAPLAVDTLIPQDWVKATAILNINEIFFRKL